MTGVELDTTTASISRHLYPAADVRAESFADTRLPTRHFDAVVGNVPFAKVTLHDPAHNADGHSIHNHFIIKSLALTHPGGMVAVLSSHSALDAANPAARREMNQMADLVGAVRLPSGAFRRSAGTEAVTDLLLFRRRLPGEPKADTTWEPKHTSTTSTHACPHESRSRRRRPDGDRRIQLSHARHRRTTNRRTGRQPRRRRRKRTRCGKRHGSACGQIQDAKRNPAMNFVGQKHRTARLTKKVRRAVLYTSFKKPS